MAGLLNQGGRVQPAPQDRPPPTDTRQMGEDGRGAEDDVLPDEVEPNVHPEEQAEYERFVKDALAQVYQQGGQVNPGILKMLDDDPSDLIKSLGDIDPLASQSFTPRVALAATAVVVVLEVVRSRAESEGKPDGELIFHAGSEILEDLSNLANEAGINQYDQEDVNAAMLIAMDIYRTAAEAEGLLDPEEAAQDWDEIVAADRRGPEALNALLPGIGSRAPAEEAARPAMEPQPGDEEVA